MKIRPDETPELHRAIEVTRRLRGPGGCPWDKKQTHESLTRYLIEESYEFIEAVEDLGPAEQVEELGDVLFQVLLHSTIAEQEKRFNLEEVAKTLSEKMIRRHPHVFSDLKVEGPAGVRAQWQEIKDAEKLGEKKRPIEVLQALPSLLRAQKIGEKTRHFNFDWSTEKEVFAQVEEELEELRDCLDRTEPNKEALTHELGDLLFSVTQLARHLEIDAEQAHRKANNRFLQRFEKMLEIFGGEVQDFKKLDQKKKEKLWQLAKKEVG